MTTTPKTILRIDASMRREQSVSRMLATELSDALGARKPSSSLVSRDLALGVGMVNEGWITANHQPEENRTSTQRALLALSDALVAELKAADVIIFAVPIYNFSIPAALKAWVDLIARSGTTYDFDAESYESTGLLVGKSAYAIITSGGTLAGSPHDFATGYLSHVLDFLGISDVNMIDATGVGRDRVNALARARAEIKDIAEARDRPTRKAAE